METGVVAAPVAGEARARFQRVHHEAVAGAGADDGGLEGAGAAGGRVGHLGGVLAEEGGGGVGRGGEKGEGTRERGVEGGDKGGRKETRGLPAPRCWVVVEPGAGAGAAFRPWLGGWIGGCDDCYEYEGERAVAQAMFWVGGERVGTGWLINSSLLCFCMF